MRVYRRERSSLFSIHYWLVPFLTQLVITLENTDPPWSSEVRLYGAFMVRLHILFTFRQLLIQCLIWPGPRD